jgi:hypothetical protein
MKRGLVVPILIFLVGAGLLFSTRYADTVFGAHHRGAPIVLYFKNPGLHNLQSLNKDQASTPPKEGEFGPADVRLFMQMIVSLAFLCVGLFMAISGRFTAPQKHWAFGILGTVAGFWLK